MKSNLTDISIVLDRSGSMMTVQQDTIGGYNTFIEEQKKVPGEANVSLYQFNTEYEKVYAGVKLADVKPLNSSTFRPAGNTALLDAVCKTIIDTGARLEKLPEAERPGKVIIVIMTDGEENASREYNYDNVKRLIKQQEDQYNWTFVFLGANIDVAATAAKLGVAKGNAVGYTSDPLGTHEVFEGVTRGLTNYRSSDISDSSHKNFSSLMNPKK